MKRPGFAHRTFQRAGCDIHYWHRPGRGKRHVLFFHGAGVDHRMFETQMDIFDDSWHITLWDARGHGLSALHPGKVFDFEDMVDDCGMLYASLGIEKAVLVGQSMGGNLAQEIAYRDPDRVIRMVLIGCTRNTGVLTPGEALMLRLSGPILRLYPWRTLIRQSANACGNTEGVRQYVRDCFEGMGKASLLAVMGALTACLHGAADYRLPCPTLLLCGGDDRTGNIRNIMGPWAEIDASCTLHMIEHAGHNANQDAPQAVNGHMARFLKFYDREV